MKTDGDELKYSAEESRSHYTTPDGFFESLEDRIMARIDEEPAPLEEQSTPPLGKRLIWQRLRPYIYLAASFVLTIGMFRGFRYIRSQQLSSSAVEQAAKLEKEKATQYYELLAGEYTEESGEENLWILDTNYID
ncbi:hypothetical protein [uncultured Porphyromonas sp.]|uniref:hypothetical protein n=1 Tax=uncultured Porphyromonas sp. TaxID=159274 RepID=UPI002622D803|nr:hypothetical protein [uncultured Porphyromonas sp.]